MNKLAIAAGLDASDFVANKLDDVVLLFSPVFAENKFAVCILGILSVFEPSWFVLDVAVLTPNDLDENRFEVCSLSSAGLS